MPFLNLGVVPCARSLSDAFGTTLFSSMERAGGFRRLAGFPEIALRLPLAMLAMRLALHALNKVSLLAEGFGKARQPPKPKCFFRQSLFYLRR